jgi:hypothetical protein
MCTEDRALREVVAHTQDCANALQARIDAVGSDLNSDLPSSVKTELALARHSARFLTEAVAQLRNRFPD